MTSNFRVYNFGRDSGLKEILYLTLPGNHCELKLVVDKIRLVSHLYTSYSAKDSVYTRIRFDVIQMFSLQDISLAI